MSLYNHVLPLLYHSNTNTHSLTSSTPLVLFSSSPSLKTLTCHVKHSLANTQTLCPTNLLPANLSPGSIQPYAFHAPKTWQLNGTDTPIHPWSPTSTEPCILSGNHGHCPKFTLPDLSYMSNLLLLPLTSSHLVLADNLTLYLTGLLEMSKRALHPKPTHQKIQLCPNIFF